MKVLLIVLLVLLILLLLPFGGAARYDQDGFAAWVKVLCFRFKVFPREKGKKKKAKKEKAPPQESAGNENKAPTEKQKDPGEKDTASPKKDAGNEDKAAAAKQKDPGKKETASSKKNAGDEDKAPTEKQKKGGALDLVRAALPLVRPALAGVKKRLTIDDLELFVTWRSDDPADAAIGYGRASAALGALWALVDDNFKVKKSRLGCRADFGDGRSEVYASAALSLNLWKTLTLGVPLLVRFLRNYTRLKRARDDKTKKEA